MSINNSQVALQGFSDRLRAIIEAKGVSQKATAAYLGIAETQLSRYFRGQIPEPKKLLQIAEWGGVSLDWLLTGRDPLLQVSQLLTKADAGNGTTHQSPRSDKSVNELLSHWTELDDTNRQRLLSILVNFKAMDLPILEPLELLCQAMAAQAQSSNRKLLIQRKAVLSADVRLLCEINLTPGERAEFEEEVVRRQQVLQSRLKKFRSDTHAIVSQTDRRVRRRLKEGFRKIAERLVEIFEGARSPRLKSRELSLCLEECLAIAKIYPDGELSLVRADPRRIAEVREILINDFAQCHSVTMTENAWAEWKRHMIRKLTGYKPSLTVVRRHP